MSVVTHLSASAINTPVSSGSSQSSSGASDPHVQQQTLVRKVDHPWVDTSSNSAKGARSRVKRGVEGEAIIKEAGEIEEEIEESVANSYRAWMQRNPARPGEAMDDWPTDPELHEMKRPDMPIIDSGAGGKEIISRVFEKTDGLFVGEDHENDAATGFLIDNMASLAKDGKVNRLYVEGFPKDVQPDLDAFFAGKGVSEKLNKEIKDLDDSYPHVGRYKTMDLLEAARKNGIRIKATETKDTQKAADLDDSRSRLRLFNKQLAEDIESDQRQMGGHYVALLGKAHVGDVGIRAENAASGERYPGVDRLRQGISLIIEYIRKGEAPGLTKGRPAMANEDEEKGEGEEHGILKGQTATYSADFELKLRPPGV